MKKKNLFTVTGILIVVLAFAGCGGDDGGDPYVNVTASTSEGVVTGFGSVIVNGVPYDSSSATVSVEGSPAAEVDLRVGMVVSVKGSYDSAAGTGTADSIVYADHLQGPIAAVDLAAKSLTVLGQTIVVDVMTQFRNTTDITTLVVGDIVEVSGHPDHTGTIRATYIEKKAVGSEYEIKGTVSNLNITAKTFTLRVSPLSPAVTVTYAGVTLPVGVVDGAYVEVKTGADISGVTISASAVEVETEVEITENDHVEIEGYVTDFVSLSEFRVSGILVNAGGLSIVGIGNGVAVEVEGTYSGGVLVASAVEMHHPCDVMLEGYVADKTSSSFTVLGKTVTVTDTTEFEDGISINPIRTFSFADIGNGDYLEVVGYLDDATGHIVAGAVKRRDAIDRAVVQGVVTSSTVASSLVVLGITVSVDLATEFRDADDLAISAATFFSLLISNSTTVEATWETYTSLAEPATKLEIE